MRVEINHVEKSQGLVFKKTLYGVSISVTFSEEEKQIIKQRGIERVVILERDPPADVDAEKHANRGLAAKLVTAAMKGRDANHFDLTIGKLLNGRDTYFMHTIVNAKNYEQALRDSMVDLKGYITESAGVEQKSDSFEL
jgi:hypothetical protein